MLELYLDDSCDYKDPQHGRYTVVGGAIASEQAWTDLVNDWAAIYERFGVTWLHMRAFAHSIEEFEGWAGDEARRKAFLGELFSAFSRRQIFPVGCVQDFREFARAPESEQKGQLSPFLTAFAISIQAANDLTEPFVKLSMDDIRRGVDSSREGKGEEIRVIAAHQPGEVGEMRTMYSSLTKRFPRLLDTLSISCSKRHKNTGPRTCECSTKGIRELIPLQFADIVAFELGERVGLEKTRWPYQQLLTAERRLLWVNEAIRWDGSRYVRDDGAPIIR